MITIYGTFEEEEGTKHHITGVFREIDGTRWLETTEDSNQKINFLPSNVVFNSDLQGLNISSLQILEFEINNIEKRKKHPKYRRAEVYTKNKGRVVALVDKDVIELINHNNYKMIRLIDDKLDLFINVETIENIRFMESRNLFNINDLRRR